MKKALTLIELLVSFCVIFLVVGVFFYNGNKVLRTAREKALIHQLLALRKSIHLYRIVNKTNPQTLDDIRWVRQKKGNVYRRTIQVDPFGNLYIYSADTGDVHSSTSRYESW